MKTVPYTHLILGRQSERLDLQSRGYFHYHDMYNHTVRNNYIDTFNSAYHANT